MKIPNDFTEPLPEHVFDFNRMDAMLAAIRERSDRFDASLDAEQQTKPCDIHGTPAPLNRDASFRQRKPVWTCPDCEGEKLTKRHAKRIEAAGIPADVRSATLENFDTNRPDVKKSEGCVSPAKFIEAARRFQAGEVRNVGFAGTPGIGKGHLAAALCISAIAAGKSVAWIECARLFAEYHRAYKTDQTDEVTSHYASPDMIVLDEICLRDLPADGEEILFGILDRRHKAGLQTIFLGNAPAEAIRKWLGSRIVDRLRSGGVAFCYGEWASMRGTTGDGASEF